MQKLFLFLVFIISLNFSAKSLHPYHVGSVEFKYNEKSKTFEVSARFFLDDLENAVNKKYGKTVHFNDAKFKDQINVLLKSYCEDYLKIKVNNKAIKLNYLGFEEDKESVDIYLETEAVLNPKKIETAVSLLYSYYDDQMNIVHIIVKDVRKSSEVVYPNRYLYQQF
ncbi:DUF6702 family protein [Halpernia frigidisoli]|uniref:Uncharacterized protein n=1 Tax=Halpernia frigidisoli TaxID=1125876 RepID=A0A1I3FWM0_9FLAO|nr:DUF6702 family protein [Halpernia frigidisoli]SFI15585.1 hypothetical protein SAMN05443292_1680 [Halpernia frigidisoli]